jgi:hypothetical protein
MERRKKVCRGRCLRGHSLSPVFADRNEWNQVSGVGQFTTLIQCADLSWGECGRIDKLTKNQEAGTLLIKHEANIDSLKGGEILLSLLIQWTSG